MNKLINFINKSKIKNTNKFSLFKRVKNMLATTIKYTIYPFVFSILPIIPYAFAFDFIFEDIHLDNITIAVISLCFYIILNLILTKKTIELKASDFIHNKKNKFNIFDSFFNGFDQFKNKKYHLSYIKYLLAGSILLFSILVSGSYVDMIILHSNSIFILWPLITISFSNYLISSYIGKKFAKKMIKENKTLLK